MIEQAMIFAAGLGTRMLPLTTKVPKPLIKINNKSILLNNIEKLVEASFENIVVNAYHLSDQIVSEVKDYYPRVKVVIENERLETGGGLLNAIKKGLFDFKKDVLLMNGDIYWKNNNYNSLNRIIKLWNPKEMDMFLCLKRKNQFFGYDGPGDFCLLDESYDYSRLDKSNDLLYVFTGLQIIRQKIIRNKKKKIFSMKELIVDSLKKKKLFGYSDENDWFHISTSKDLKSFIKNYK